MTIWKQCEHCQGRGRVKLSALFTQTLAVVRKYPGLSGAKLARKLPPAQRPSGEAMCNRLRALHQMGLVTFIQEGREKRWRERN